MSGGPEQSRCREEGSPVEQHARRAGLQSSCNDSTSTLDSLNTARLGRMHTSLLSYVWHQLSISDGNAHRKRQSVARGSTSPIVSLLSTSLSGHLALPIFTHSNHPLIPRHQILHNLFESDCPADREMLVKWPCQRQ